MAEDPYVDPTAPSEEVGRYWALNSLRWEAEMLGMRPAGGGDAFLAARASEEQRRSFAGGLVKIAELAAPGSDLPAMAERFVMEGFPETLQEDLLSHCRELQRELLEGPLHDSPATRQKTVASLVAFFQHGGISNEDDDDLLEAALMVGDAVPQNWRSSVEERWRDEAEGSGIFWSRGPTAYENVLRYRVGHSFGFSGLDELWHEVESEVSRTLVEGGEADPFSLAVVSQSPELTEATRASARLALNFLVDAQEPDGRWRNPRGRDAVFDIGPTADAVIALDRLGFEASQRESAHDGARWLIDQQQDSGAWPGIVGDELRDSPAVTARAVEAIVRSGADIPGDVPARAIRWLWAQQDELGFWEDIPGRSSFLATSFVLDSLAVFHGQGGPTIGDLLVPSQVDLAGAVASPTLRDDIYEDIISRIRQAGSDMENAPSVYLSMGEEARRHVIQMALNGSYAGLFAAEAYNVGGKTDLLLRYQGVNLFIAECKFWTGQAGFIAALDQLLGYAGWRDRKLALVMFVRGRDPQLAVDRGRSALEQHAAFAESRESGNDNELRAAVRLPETGGGALADLTALFIHTYDESAPDDEANAVT
jgi:hypothetical protein